MVLRVDGGGMKQALKAVFKVGGKGMEYTPLVALAVGDRRMEETLPPVPRVTSRRCRLLSCLFLE